MRLLTAAPSPHNARWVSKTVPAGPIPVIREGEKGPKWADFRYEMRLTHRLTGQGRQ